MFLLTRDSIDDIRQAQTNEQILNQFIENNKRFILSCACRSVRHFVSESDDEWSIAMIAFHEAVCSFDTQKGDFHKFAGMVIHRRLLDYLRSEARYAREISVEPSVMNGGADGEEELSALQMQVCRKEAEMSSIENADVTEASDLKDEIASVQQQLAKYGFSFFDLAECSPKADKTKKGCARAVDALLQNQELFQQMQGNAALPVKQLSAAAGITKKLLERHRRYIIAAAEILNGEYPLLAEYMSYIRRVPDRQRP